MKIWMLAGKKWHQQNQDELYEIETANNEITFPFTRPKIEECPNTSTFKSLHSPDRQRGESPERRG